MAPRRRRSLVIRFAWPRTFYLFFFFFLHGTFLDIFAHPFLLFSAQCLCLGPSLIPVLSLWFSIWFSLLFWFFDACCIATFLNYDTRFSLKYSSVCEGSSFTF
jgi:hypothetical protein